MSAPRGLAALRRVLLAAWSLSAASQIVGEWRALQRGPAPHPEMPGDEQDRGLAVLAACRARVGPGDLLVVAGGAGAVEVFLRYRLAYELYPAHVIDADQAAESVAEALRTPGPFVRRFAVVLGAPDVTLAGAAPSPITPQDRLFESRP